MDATQNRTAFPPPPKGGGFHAEDTVKFFVLGLPHTQTQNPATSATTTCAFTSKIFYLCRMLHQLGHEVIHLGLEGSAADCSEHVDVAKLAEWVPLYGHRRATDYYDCGVDGPKAVYMERYVLRVKLAIAERTSKPYEAIVCNTFGAGAQQTACQGLNQFVWSQVSATTIRGRTSASSRATLGCTFTSGASRSSRGTSGIGP